MDTFFKLKILFDYYFIVKNLKRQIFLISLKLKMLNGSETLGSILCDPGQKKFKKSKN